MAASKVSMKLLINTESNQVLFAEAGKECVDFLFHILCLPVATVIMLLKEQGMVGCLENLYLSIKNLNETYMQPDKTKDSLLKPYTPSVPLFLLEGGSAPTEKVLYKCTYSGQCLYFSDVKGAKCRNCTCSMNSPMTYVAGLPGTFREADAESGGFVKGVVTYMVMDDLFVSQCLRFRA